MAGEGDKPGDLKIGMIALGGVLVLGEMLGVAGFYSAVSGGELIFIQAIISAALIIVPILWALALWSDIRKKREK